jgi:hypothetical protein
MALRAEVKYVGDNGQISLGKEYAGKQVQIMKSAEGTITIKTGNFIPDSERWLHQGDNLKKLNEAITWAENTPRNSDNFEEIMKKLSGDE